LGGGPISWSDAYNCDHDDGADSAADNKGPSGYDSDSSQRLLMPVATRRAPPPG